MIGVPIGVCILSYRKQAGTAYDALSPTLEKAVKESILESEFIYERVAYDISFRRLQSSDLVLNFDVIMNLRNRSKNSALYEDIFDPAGFGKTFIFASVAGNAVNVTDRDRISLRGLRLTHRVQANGAFQVRVNGESTFHSRDSELVGVYLPCDQFSIIIRKPMDDLDIHVQSLLRNKLDPLLLPNGDIEIVYSDGMLPFQGVRLFWESRLPCP